MLKPIFDKVIVKLQNSEEVTESGIILGQINKEKTQIAEVIEVGTGGIIDGKQTEMQVKKGDTVLLNKYAGTEIKFENEDYIVICQTDILAVVEK
jgi:chaperonin GroES